jgi:hypothetical protein
MANREWVTITHHHVSNPFFHAFGNVWSTSDFIGRILLSDVGKRVYLVKGILQVESDEQKYERLAR